MKISNFNPVMLQGCKLTDGRNPYTDVYLLSDSTIFKHLKPANCESFRDKVNYENFYNSFCAKLSAADKLNDIAELVLPEEIAIDDKKYVKGFSYKYVNLPDLTSYFNDIKTIDDVTEIYLLLIELTDKLYERGIIVPDLLTISNVLYDKQKRQIKLIDYDGMQIGNIPTNAISCILKYWQNPILRSKKYSNRDRTYTKEINTISFLVDYLYKLSGINVAANHNFQDIYYLELDGSSLNKTICDINEMFNMLGIDDEEIIDGYISLFSIKKDNPEARRLIKKFNDKYQFSSHEMDENKIRTFACK